MWTVPDEIVQPVFVNPAGIRTPTFPVIVEVVHVTAGPPRTAKVEAEPSDGSDCAEAAEGLRTSAATGTMAESRIIRRREAHISIMRSSLRGFAQPVCVERHTSDGHRRRLNALTMQSQRRAREAHRREIPFTDTNTSL